MYFQGAGKGKPPDSVLTYENEGSQDAPDVLAHHLSDLCNMEMRQWAPPWCTGC